MSSKAFDSLKKTLVFFEYSDFYSFEEKNKILKELRSSTKTNNNGKPLI